ncbi:MAG TPA: glycine zipper 2TM domain-containing protein [Allosphingosinicella sp.]|uniref:glycine zipper 2TM domain-containing protein n=1 Tax=Allosphingosinicella sp. TaxID=2823234 RepID=UPI002EDA30FB
MRKLTLAFAAATMTVPVAMPAPVHAQGYYTGKTWRGADGRLYCKRRNGTTGLIVGGAAGALVGRAIDTRGERTTGTILGAAAGALLGRHVDRNRKGGYTCR